ncbi:MAG TPA: rhomboid family intramembrane serine protease [Opitutaceae bacterium]
MFKRVITIALATTAVLWTFWILQSGADDFEWRRFGISNGYEVFSGDYWTLLSSLFAHVDPLHLLFNVYWLYLLGGYAEEHYGRRFYILLVLISGFCASTLELSFTGSTGVGLSGVLYAIFGFLWGETLFTKVPIEVLPKPRVWLFLAWLLFCIGLTESGVMAIGNVAHFTGLVIGLSTAFARSSRRLAARLLIPGVVGFCGVAIFYSPWSYVWLASRAIRAHEAGKWADAERYYSSILEREPNAGWALENRGNIRIYLGRESEGNADLSLAKGTSEAHRPGR